VRRSESEVIFGRIDGGGGASVSRFWQVIEQWSTKSELLEVCSAEGHHSGGEVGGGTLAGQCGLRTLGVTEGPGVPECGRAPRYRSREASCRDGAEERALSSGLP